jgi:hypothetical protein
MYTHQLDWVYTEENSSTFSHAQYHPQHRPPSPLQPLSADARTEPEKDNLREGGVAFSLKQVIFAFVFVRTLYRYCRLCLPLCTYMYCIFCILSEVKKVLLKHLHKKGKKGVCRACWDSDEATAMIHDTVLSITYSSIHHCVTHSLLFHFYSTFLYMNDTFGMNRYIDTKLAN